MYRYVVDERAHLIVAAFEGVVTDSDLFEYLAHMLGHTGYGPGWSSLIDLTTASSMNLTTAGVQRMRALPLHLEERLRGARAAIIAHEGSPAFAMARMYERMGDSANYEIAVFTDRQGAMVWLHQNLAKPHHR